MSMVFRGGVSCHTLKNYRTMTHLVSLQLQMIVVSVKETFVKHFIQYSYVKNDVLFERQISSLGAWAWCKTSMCPPKISEDTRF